MDKNQLTRLQEIAAIDRLNHMMSKSFFDNCAITDAAELLGVVTCRCRYSDRCQCKNCEAFKILSTLHCVEFKKMNPELRAHLPSLIKEALRLKMEVTDSAFSTIVDITPASEPTFLQRIGLKGK